MPKIYSYSIYPLSSGEVTRQSGDRLGGMDTETLGEFLNEANKATYANKSAEKVAPTRVGSRDYEFTKGGLVYHDTYFGSRDFIGEEVVYEEGKPVWGANYYGFIPDPAVDTDEVYDFLRLALMQEYSDIIPVRGPKSFADGSRMYTFSVTGDLANFEGVEEISFNGTTVYRCFVHGGFTR